MNTSSIFNTVFIRNSQNCANPNNNPNMYVSQHQSDKIQWNFQFKKLYK